MSYLVVHMDKFKKEAIRGIQSHNQRERKSHSNPDIDYGRSELNYDLHNQTSISFAAVIDSRIDQLDLKKAPRHDAVYMCGVIVSSNQEFFSGLSADETRRFFKESYKYLSDLVGTENVISAAVHMDEKTPHLHFTHVPVTSDGRLNANKIYTRDSLRKMQSDFPEYLRKCGFEIDRGVEQIPGAAKVHLNTRDFKQQCAAINEAAIEAGKLNDELAALRSGLESGRAEESRLAEKIGAYEELAREAEAEISNHASLPAPKMMNAKEIYAAATEIIDLQKKALIDKRLIETRYDDLLERQGKMQDRLGELEAANKELKSAQADFDEAVQDAAYKATKKAAMAGKNHQAISKELQIARESLKRLEEFVKRPEVRQLYERFESGRKLEKESGRFTP